MNTIANKLKRARKRKKMSQVEFSRHLGVPLKTLQGWEQGARRPRGLSLLALDRLIN